MEETRSYTAESELMSLARFAERYRPCPGSPQAAVVVSGSGLQTSEQEVLAEGREWEIESISSETVCWLIHTSS